MITDDCFALIYDSIRLSQYFYIEEVRGRGVIGQEVQLLDVSGLDGAHLIGSKIGVRPLEVDIVFWEKNDIELRKIIEQVNGILRSKVTKELMFEDEPDRTYQAITSGVNETFEWNGIHKSTVSFLCPDPYKYGTENHQEAIDGLAVIHNHGTADSFPVITAEVLEPITFLNVLNGETYMQIGEPVDVNVTPIDPQTRLLWSQCNTLVGWTDSASVIDGTVTGTMKTDGYWFHTDTYGTGGSWHGPAVKTSLSESLQDFSLEVTLQQRVTDPKQVGRVVVELLDANNTPVARIQMWRRHPYANTNFALFTLHNGVEQQVLYHETGASDWTWNDFYGMLRISRKGNVWSIYVAQIDKASLLHTARAWFTWNDNQGRFMNKVNQVLAHLGAYGTYPATSQRIDDIKVYRLNDTEQAVETIAHPGDIIEIDHTKNRILINGQDRKDLKNFGADYFPLTKGENRLFIFPPDAAAVGIRWRDRFI